MDEQNSILLSIKKLLGMEGDYDCFDTDVIIHVNTALAILSQLGVGRDSFYITGVTEKWEDFTDYHHKIEFMKTFVYLKVKLIFDPPASSTAVKAMEEAAKELEWRINVAVDPNEH